MVASLHVFTDVDGRLVRSPLAERSVGTELVSPPSSKDGCKHCLAVAAIDAVQLALIGPANSTDSGTVWFFSLLCVLTSALLRNESEVELTFNSDYSYN